MKRVAAALLPILSFGADPVAFGHWTAKELKAFEQSLKPKMSSERKSASQSMGRWGNHLAQMSQRAGDGEAEVHETVSDFFIVQTGEATLVIGGEISEAKTTAPNEIRGSKINGGERRKLAAGDIVHIPMNTPHQVLVENGKQLTYFLIKVQK